MLKRKWVAARLFAVLGGAGLAFGLCVPKANAQAPTPGNFSNANYANRYVCNEASDDNFFIALMTLFPNGTGTFTTGTMQAPDSAFTVFDAGLPPPSNYCAYTLDVAGSSYLVSSNGTGVEVLSWTGPATNNVNCPDSPGTFIMSDTFVMRINGARPSGAVVRTEVTSNNLLDEDEPGLGHCLK
jgi:hypothetical protein